MAVMERNDIRQTGNTHLSAHMDSVILVQHFFLSAYMQSEKRRLKAVGYRQEGRARFERHFNCFERGTAMLLGVCICFAVY